MSILKTINAVRRAVLRRLTRNLGKTRLDGRVHAANIEVKRVLVCRPNHRLGNLLLITPLIQELSEVLPGAKVDLFVKGTIAPVVLKNYGNVDRIIQLPKKPFKELFRFLKAWTSIRTRHYDIAINVVFNSSSGRICTQTANATYRFFGELDKSIAQFGDREHMAKFPVYSFRYFINKLGYPLRSRTVPPLDLKLESTEIAEGGDILKGIVKNERKTIAIYTYATGHKCYEKQWWQKFYGLLKEKFSDHNIMEILPIENVSQISFQAPAFYSKELRQIGAVIANTEVFIGADSGMMHLASATPTPVVGLFKSNNMNTYAPYNRGSVGINTNETSTEECLDLIADILVQIPGSVHGEKV